MNNDKSPKVTVTPATKTNPTRSGITHDPAAPEGDETDDETEPRPIHLKPAPRPVDQDVNR